MRAGVQAYRQAIVNAGKSGAAGGAGAAAARSAGQMSLEEAHKILGAPPGASTTDLLARYNHLFRANDECGSFYLASKVYRARERIEAEVGPLETGQAGGGGGGGAPGAGPGGRGG